MLFFKTGHLNHFVDFCKHASVLDQHFGRQRMIGHYLRTVICMYLYTYIHSHMCTHTHTAQENPSLNLQTHYHKGKGEGKHMVPLHIKHLRILCNVITFITGWRGTFTTNSGSSVHRTAALEGEGVRYLTHPGRKAN